MSSSLLGRWARSPWGSREAALVVLGVALGLLVSGLGGGGGGCGAAADAQDMQGMAHTADYFRESRGFDWASVDRVFVLPGGGPGEDGLPRWTVERCDSALRAFEALTAAERGRAAFLSLSAGSMNAPSARGRGGAVVFESSAIAGYLSSRGVPRASILCDLFSWDTVGNALHTRRVLISLLQLRPGRRRLHVEVHISDFHADRVRAALEWALGAAPSVLPSCRLTVVPVPSAASEAWPLEQLRARREHELKASAQVRQNARSMPSAAALAAYVDLQAHEGYFAFAHGSYAASKGAGWGASGGL